MEIYQRFREIRKVLKMTQTEFGKQLGKTMRAIQNYESGERNINNDIIMILLVSKFEFLYYTQLRTSYKKSNNINLSADNYIYYNYLALSIKK